MDTRPSSLFLAAAASLLAPAGAQQELFVCTSKSEIYRIDDYPTAPQPVLLGAVPVQTFDIAAEPVTGDFFVAAGQAIYRLDATTLQETYLGYFPVSVNSLDLTRDGQLLARAGSSGELFLMDPDTGDFTSLGDTGVSSLGDIAEDFDGWYLGAGPGNVVDRIDPATAQSTVVGAPAVDGQIFGLEVDLDGTIYALTHTRSIYLLERDTADPQLVATLTIPNTIYGAAFSVPASDVEPIGTNYCGPANLNSLGLSAEISALGSTNVLLNSLELTASSMPPDEFGYFLTSQTQAFVPFPPGSEGNLCLGGAIGRFVKDVLDSGPGGEFALEVDLQAIPQPSGPVAIQPGETWSFQAWYRDKNPTPTSNFTDGIEITFQ